MAREGTYDELERPGQFWVRGGDGVGAWEGRLVEVDIWNRISSWSGDGDKSTHEESLRGCSGERSQRAFWWWEGQEEEEEGVRG